MDKNPEEIVDGLNNMDMPIVMGSVLIVSAAFIVINIVVDVTYAIVDQRVRLK